MKLRMKFREYPASIGKPSFVGGPNNPWEPQGGLPILRATGFYVRLPQEKVKVTLQYIRGDLVKITKLSKRTPQGTSAVFRYSHNRMTSLINDAAFQKTAIELGLTSTALAQIIICNHRKRHGSSKRR